MMFVDEPWEFSEILMKFWVDLSLMEYSHDFYENYDLIQSILGFYKIFLHDL